MRKLVYVIAPTLGLLAFAGFYGRWSSEATDCGVSRTAFAAGQDGEREAERALRAGRLAILSSGLPPVWIEEYRQILHQRYGIELRTVGGCVVDDELIAYSRAYNRVMARAVAARFGPDIFENAAAEARQRCETGRQ